MCKCPLIQRTIVSSPIITIKNTICLGHKKSCNCCCCSNSQPACFKYVQPEVPKSFKPIRSYRKNNVSMDTNTTYKLSYWEGSRFLTKIKSIKKDDSLTVGDGEINDDTIYKLSFFGNWNVIKEIPKIKRKARQWLGRGPMQDVTTNNDAYTWKYISRSKPSKRSNNIYCSRAPLTDDTTYKLSYIDSIGHMPVPQSFKPQNVYSKNDVPMEECTTYKLSYWPYEIPSKEIIPWNQKIEYQVPSTSIEDYTTYNLSYWPNNEPVRKPINHVLKQTENILNVSDNFDDNTTYNLSYFSCGENTQRRPIKPVVQPMAFFSCPLSDDTINRLSYLGNWNVKSEKPYIPSSCKNRWFGRGPIQSVTTQQQDFTWKFQEVESAVSKPKDNFGFSSSPLESSTTHKLSYFPNDFKDLIKNKSFKPPMSRVYQPPDVPFNGETTMQLSYQPVEAVIPQGKPWATGSGYHPPFIPMEDNTIYNQSYIPPGTLEPVSCDKSHPPLSNMCQATCTPSSHSLSSMSKLCCTHCPS
ncbi:uncharacterized protein [Chelonus insularis]|uniref:uncharacterized protein isoform X2 n=1 Tax=Chelonus insularis TaxID=460826 RepID=UPI0015892004|nr:uncharacterized protein LOC118069679 isoform X2 [Chelonus insularis]